MKYLLKWEKIEVSSSIIYERKNILSGLAKLGIKTGPKLARKWPKSGPKLTRNWPEMAKI